MSQPYRSRAATRWIAILILLVASLLAAVFWHHSIQNAPPIQNASRISSANGEKRKGESAAFPAKNSREAKLDRKSTARVPSYSAAEHIAKWDESTAGLSGKALNQTQWALARKAVESLSGMEIASFIDHIEKNVSRDVLDWVISIGGARLISSVEREQAKDWVINLQNHKIQSDLLFFMGTSYIQNDTEDYLQRIPSASSKAAFLAGYCVNLAQTEPTGAVDTFLRLRPANSDSKLLDRVVSILPESADYKSIFGTLTDHLGTEAESRQSTLLRRWASHDPAAAAEFATNLPDDAPHSQLTSVLNQWLEDSPEDARTWIETISNPDRRTTALQALSTKIASDDPKSAWHYALMIDDQETQKSTLDSIYASWVKSDKAAADEAVAKIRNTPNN